MTLRINLDPTTEEAVLDVVTRYLSQILGNTKSVGARTTPDWEENLTEDRLLQHIAGDIPVSTNDNLVSFQSLQVAPKLTHHIRSAFPNSVVTPSGFFHYPKTGYMGWHTNSDVPCRRMYITWAAESGESYFRYYQDGRVITDYDDKGLTFRLFNITDKPPYLWHCVGSNTDRISIGYRIRDTHNGR